MRIVLIADTFPPLRSSGAVQLRDLAREFVRQKYKLTVLLPSPDQKVSCNIQKFDGAEVIRLKAPKTKDVSYVRRTIAELLMPFYMLRGLKKSHAHDRYWDGVVWYSPSIFHGPLVHIIKYSSRCKSYLIIRDIFPEWALDMGLMSRGLKYYFFNAIAQYQYSVADVIGIQSPGNENYFRDWLKKRNRRLEVLPNWLGGSEHSPSSINIDITRLSGRKVFIYAGNMGVAQGMDIFFGLADKLKNRQDIGFLFVGRGSEVIRLKKISKSLQLDNVDFYDEIDPDEIPNLYSQCIAGIVALDNRHRSHNIPGKFLTYLQNGLPVLANVNTGNDIVNIIKENKIGQACDSNDVNDLVNLTEKLLADIKIDKTISKRCINLFNKEFAVKKTVEQIVRALSS